MPSRPFSSSLSRESRLCILVNGTRSHGRWRNLQRIFPASVESWVSVTATHPLSPSWNGGVYCSRQSHSRTYHLTSMGAFPPTRSRPSQLELLELLIHHHLTIGSPIDLSLASPSCKPFLFLSTYTALSFSQKIGAVYGMMTREQETQSHSSTSGSSLRRFPHSTSNSLQVGARTTQCRSVPGGQVGQKQIPSPKQLSRPWRQFFPHLMNWSVIPTLATELHHPKHTSSNHHVQEVS